MNGYHRQVNAGTLRGLLGWSKCTTWSHRSQSQLGLRNF